MKLQISVFHLNTFMKMLNQLFREHNLPEIKVGIGMSTAQELVVKAGRKGVGINSKIWMVRLCQERVIMRTTEIKMGIQLLLWVPVVITI